MIPRLLSIPSAAAYLGCAKSKMYAMLPVMNLPTVLVGKREMIDREDLDRWIETQKRKDAK